MAEASPFDGAVPAMLQVCLHAVHATESAWRTLI
jgi:hypothetical protein